VPASIELPVTSGAHYDYAMFQTYDAAQGQQDNAARLARFRELMARLKVDAVLVPHADEFMNEYLPPSNQRLAWLTGFTGSAGLAVVARKTAALFVDGRYILQAPQQVDADAFEILQIPGAKPADWIVNILKAGAVVGYDPRLISPAVLDELAKGLDGKRIKLKALGRNPVDAIWGRERPPLPTGAIAPHPIKYAGKSAEEKIRDVQAELKKVGHDAVVLTSPDSICWLFNIRGADVAHNPIVLATAIVPASGKPELFVDARKVGPEAKSHLAPLAKISEPKAVEARLAALGKAKRTVRLGPAAAVWFEKKLKGANAVRAADPCTLPKARKNATEIKGARIAHKRDGAAMARFLAWLDQNAVTGSLDEIAAAQKLEAIRSETQTLKEISFDTISGAGPNGAIVHYRVTAATNRKLRPGELYLVDSGAQYLEGTTDITRAVAVGVPSPEMRERFTLVLKGHIAVATARFPKGTRGIDLDPFARRALWAAGLDYDHGTGHGVGSYLSVHEGPQSISKAGMAVLEPGMIVSNEPGYYKTGGYGIRIENLLLVSEPEKITGGERETMTFETLTLVPIDRRLILPELMSDAEIAWLDAYHRRVRDEIGPHLSPGDRQWLLAVTEPIRR
jgi:Xaa-Pro aminopeptidase